MADIVYLLHTQQEIFRQLKINRRIKIKFHTLEISLLENILGRSGRQIADVLLNAYKQGCQFDAWSEWFDFTKWEKSFNVLDKNIYNYSSQLQWNLTDVLPWSHIATGVSGDFLKKEYEKALQGKTSETCSEKCSQCGVC
jgi:hypothetical protein